LRQTLADFGVELELFLTNFFENLLCLIKSVEERRDYGSMTWLAESLKVAWNYAKMKLM
jgi:hypothetical protein